MTHDEELHAHMAPGDVADHLLDHHGIRLHDQTVTDLQVLAYAHAAKHGIPVDDWSLEEVGALFIHELAHELEDED